MSSFTANSFGHSQIPLPLLERKQPENEVSPQQAAGRPHFCRVQRVATPDPPSKK